MSKFQLFCFLLIPVFASAQNRPLKVFPFAEDGQWGLINQDLEIILKPSLDTIHLLRYHEHVQQYATAVRRGKQGVISREGKWLCKPKFQQVITPRRNEPSVAKVQRKGKWGLVDLETGKTILQPQLDEIGRFRTDSIAIAKARVGDKQGILLSDGTWMYQPVYDEVGIMLAEWMRNQESYVSLEKNGITEYYNLDGEKIIVEAGEAEMIMEVEEEPSDYSGPYKVDITGDPEQGTILRLFRRHNNNNRPPMDSLFIDPGLRLIDYREQWMPDKFSYEVPHCVIQEVVTGFYGIIDHDGAVILPLVYDKIEKDFKIRALWRLEKDGLIGFLGGKAEVIYPVRFTSIEQIPNWAYLRVVRADGMIGFAEDGTVYLPKEE